jgi:uncharacterized membrane protein YgcG
MRSLLAVLFAAAAFPVAADQVVLYEGHELRGRQVTITKSTPNLGYLGFENRASSMWVMSGQWEFCSEPYYRGDCRTLGPGEYPRLGSQSNRISSARTVPNAVTGRPPQDNWQPSGSAEVELFDRQNFSNPIRTLRGPTPNFEPLGINDAAASLIVHRGTWLFCTDANYRGECVTYGPGRYPNLPGKDDRFSSAKPQEGGWGGGGQGGWGGGGGNWGGGSGGNYDGPARIRLFEYSNFGGRSVWLDRDNANFDRLGFNDRAESVIVEGGTWRLCSDANGNGQCRTFRPGQYPTLPPDLSNRISSAYTR